jgi:hypothetical protein
LQIVRKSLSKPSLSRGLFAAGTILSVTLLSPGEAAAQKEGVLSALDGRPEFATLSRSLFEGKALYGHINGGAELYHEYGFVRLEVRSVTAGNETLAVEAYEMKDPFAAAGILSVSRGGSDPDTTLGPFAYASRFQSQFAHGAAYIRVINDKGGKAAGEEMRRVARRIRERTENTPLALSPLFADRVREEKGCSILLIRGPLGLQNGLDSWSELFEGIERFELTVLTADTLGGGVTAGEVIFSQPGDRTLFLERWPLRPGRGVIARGSTLYVIETAGSGPLVDRWRSWFGRIEGMNLPPSGQR